MQHDAFDTGRSAVISACGTFRYRLQRIHDATRARLLFVMLNPSTADAEVDDPSIRRCIGFARDGGFGSIEVVNLFAFRATSPRDLARAGHPVGPDNDAHIEHALRDADAVCVAWGTAGGDAADARAQIVLPLIRRAGHAPQCLSVTCSGWPAHPLRLPASLRLRAFDEDAIDKAMSAPARRRAFRHG